MIKMLNKIILPQTDENGEMYLSYSQKKTWKKKRDYIRQYFFGNKSDNEYLEKYGDFGNKIADVFRNEDYSGFTKKEIEFLKTIPKYDEFETEVHLDMGGWYVKCYVDSNTKVEDGYVKELLDYKTGEIDKRKVDYESQEYDQIEIYAAAFEQKYGKLPNKGKVVLIQRDGNAFKNEELKLGDKYIEIPKKITKKRIKEVKDEYIYTAREISEYYKVFLKLTCVV